MMRWLLVALLLLPAGQAMTIDNPDESTLVTLFMHDAKREYMPMNTQQPSDWFGGGPAYAPTQSACVEDPIGAQTSTSQQHHTWYAYSSPGYVVYDVDEGGQPPIASDRGLLDDIQIDANVTPMFHVSFASKDLVTWLEPEPVVPNVVVRATMREGDDASIGPVAFDFGDIIALGETTPATLAGDATPDHPHVSARADADRWIYDFTFPLEWRMDAIDEHDAYNIRIDLFVHEELCEDGYAMLDTLEPVHQRDHWPRLTMAHRNPLTIVGVDVMQVGDDAIVFAGAFSPWGLYDIAGDDTGLRLHDEPRPEAWLGDTPLEFLNITYPRAPTMSPTANIVWRIAADDVPHGDHEVRLTISNDQQTADATATFEVTADERGLCWIAARTGCNYHAHPVRIEDDCQAIEDAACPWNQEQESPGLPLAALLVCLALLAWRRR